MPEIKNTFLKSKMNKDLDDRLVPNGEYRDAQNVSIVTSEDSDAGAVENVLGNLLVADFGFSDECNLEIIGHYMDTTGDRIFVFLTNYVDTSNTRLNNHSHGLPVKSYICVYDIKTDTSRTLVEGAFLNFSTTHPITGVNLLEDLLFWTDNRNQPRKINVTRQLGYYLMEEHISVAKYYPYLPINLYERFGQKHYANGQPVVESTMRDRSNKYLPNGTTLNPYGPAGSGVDWDGDENFLKDKFIRFSYRFKFEDGEYSLMAPFTQIAFVPEQDGYFISNDDKKDIDRTYKGTQVEFMVNKINDITLMIPPPTNNSIVSPWSTAYKNFKIVEVDILYKQANGLSIKVVDTIKKDTFVTASAFNGNLDPEFGWFKYKYASQKPYKVLTDLEVTRVNDVVPVKALTQEVTGNRIIYGNFLDKHTPIQNLNYRVGVAEKGSTGPSGVTYASTFSTGGGDTLPVQSVIRKEYQNHTLKQNRSYQVGIVFSDLYGRQSSVITSSAVDNSTVYHKYKESGFSEGFGQGKLISPGTINYPADTWAGDCLTIEFFESIPETIQAEGYPGLWSESNPLGWYSWKLVVKQQEQDYYNVYFPGIINGWTNYTKDEDDPGIAKAATISDPTCHMVLHSDNLNKIPRDLKEVGPDQKLFRTTKKVQVPVNDEAHAAAIEIQNQIREYAITKWGTAEGHWEEAREALSTMNPQSSVIDQNWKQGLAMRDVVEYSQDTEQRSNASIGLFCRVQNRTIGTGYGKQFYPYSSGEDTKMDTVTTIGTGFDLGLYNASPDDAIFTEYFNVKENPLIGRLQVKDHTMGVGGNTGGDDPSPQMNPTLAIYETEPVKSRLELFWETTTSGDIKSLNENIKTYDTWTPSMLGVPGIAYPGVLVAPDLREDLNIGDDIFDPPEFWAYNNVAGTGINGTLELTSAVDGGGNDVTSKFILHTVATVNIPGLGNIPSRWKIKTSDYFWHQCLNWDHNKIYINFMFTDATTGNISEFSLYETLVGGHLPLINVQPTITDIHGQHMSGIYAGSIIGGLVLSGQAENGSADPVNKYKELSWTIPYQVDSSSSSVSYFYLLPTANEGEIGLYNHSNTPAGTYIIRLRVADMASAPLYDITNDITINIT